MSKYLTVEYYPDKHTKKLADRFNDGNGTPGDAIGEAYDKKIIFFCTFGSFDIDIGEFDNFCGSYDKLKKAIIESINDTITSYSAIGRLFIILDNCPNDYHYIVIENA